MKTKGLVIVFLFISAFCFAQQRAQYAGSIKQLPKFNLLQSLSDPAVLTLKINGDKKEQLIAPDFHTQHFGFFCRQELKMQQAHVPVTFRLGSMEQCDRLEQKTGSR